MSPLPLARRALMRVTSPTFAVITAATLALSAGVFATAPASADPLATTPHAPKYTPKFEPGPCAAGVPNDPRVECGVLTVPENRDRPQKAQVQLPVATVRSQAATKAPDPILHLAGGPGQAAFPILNFVLATDLGGPRDVIVLSQRGTAASTPNLDCPELTDATWAQFATADPPAVEQRTFDTVVRACRARLRASGVDLNSYNTITNAADVGDLRLALGVREWNIWSLSYGTALAQQVMRDHPNGLRSVVLDSTVPPDKGFGGTDEVRRGMDSIQRLLAGCATSPACNAAHPTLARDLTDVVAALDAQPYQSVVTDPDTGAQRAGRVHRAGPDLRAREHPPDLVADFAVPAARQPVQGRPVRLHRHAGIDAHPPALHHFRRHAPLRTVRGSRPHRRPVGITPAARRAPRIRDVWVRRLRRVHGLARPARAAFLQPSRHQHDPHARPRR